MSQKTRASSTAEASPATPAEREQVPETVVVETPFGCYSFGPEHRVHMPKGPLGFPEAHDFALANLPDTRLADFKLMQSLEREELRFIVTALPDIGGPIEQEDLTEIATAAGVPRGRAIFLAIVTIRQASGGVAMTVNLRAPLVFDAEARIARQIVSTNQAYPIQQPFYGWAAPTAAND